MSNKNTRANCVRDYQSISDDTMKKLFFNYLLEELKRSRQKPSLNIFTEIWIFIDSDKGKESLEKFSKTKLPLFCSRQFNLPINTFKTFFKDNLNVD